MYCPSCDKTYGAVHSRCPECHSWLKVSAPSGSRSKGSKSGSFASSAPEQDTRDSGAVSTVPRDSAISWADPAPNDSPAGAWGSGSSSSDWGDEPESALDSAPAAPSNGWGASAGSSGGWDTPSKAAAGSAWGGGEEASAASAPKPSAPPASSGNGWLGGDQPQDDWGGGGLSASAPASSGSKAKSNGWLGDEPSAGSPPPAAPPKQDDYNDGWKSGSAEPAPSGGRGWLTDGPSDEPSSDSGRGWLVDGGSTSSPSMTQMVDQAIHGETDDDFVDDSWVDEEIRDSEFDELEVPEIVGHSPEGGGAFLKMLLVAIMGVLLVGGFMFIKKDHKTPEQKEADELAQRATFAKSTIESAKADMAKGRAELAVPQFEEALVALSDTKAGRKEMDETEVLLSTALMKSEEYEKAIEHWRKLKSSPDKSVAKAAVEGINASSRELRKNANDLLKEGKSLVAKGEVNAVLPRGRDALEIYKDYGGSSAQQGDAHGVLGRAYLNGRDYGNAQDHLRLAVKMAPGIGYEKYLSEVNSRLQPVYYAPQPSSPRPSAPASRPSFDLGGKSYQTSNHRGGGGGRRHSASQAPAPSAAPAPAPRKMQELPVVRSSSRPQSSGSRFTKSRQGNLNSY